MPQREHVTVGNENPHVPASTHNADTSSNGQDLAHSCTPSGMATIVRCIDAETFEPAAIQVMSVALDDICKALNIPADAIAREVIAIRVIELAGCCAQSPTELRDSVLAEAKGGSGC
jgi:hypothetical protein